MPSLFPKEFADLEAPGATWSIGSDNEFYSGRAGSSMEDMEAFYDAVFPRAHEILAYCDRFDVRNPPEEMRVLMNMLYSLIVVSSVVEAWKRARVARAPWFRAMRQTLVSICQPRAFLTAGHSLLFRPGNRMAL